MRSMSARGALGYSIVELAVAVGLIATATATALPKMLAGLDEARVAGAARYLSARFYDTRIEAVTRSAEVALRFTATNAGYVYAVYADGNGNGVLARDIQRNIDPQLHSPEQLSSQFSGVDFGTLPGLPAIDAGSPAPGDDPIRFGTSNMVSFSALGTSSSGTLYVRGRGNTQYAIRLVGSTARVRIYRFDWRTQRWHVL
jgi:type II secretory pathway pseudopilin PulG